MGWQELAGTGRKITNFPVFHGGRCRRFAGPILGRPAAIRSEIPSAGSSRCGAPSRPARVTGGASSGPIFHGLQMNKKLNLVPGLESSFLGFLELKKCLGG